MELVGPCVCVCESRIVQRVVDRTLLVDCCWLREVSAALGSQVSRNLNGAKLATYGLMCISASALIKCD